MYSPFFPHILDAWNKRHHPNLHFMLYEDMKRVSSVINFMQNVIKSNGQCRI